jgi:hypothetical protein
MLRVFGPLPFKRVILAVNGEIVSDLPADDDLFVDGGDSDLIQASEYADGGATKLPMAPAVLSRQALAFEAAAQEGLAFVEVCPNPRAVGRVG